MKSASFVFALVLLATTTHFAAAEVDERPLPVQIEQAFPNIVWEGWSVESGDDADLPPYPFRPVYLTHAGDGSGRMFVVEQRGKVYVVPAGAGPKRAKVFLDLTDLVSYSDRQNEEGLLGLAFHPKFAENGQVFVYYTDKTPRNHKNILARYRVNKDDTGHVDPKSAEVLMTFNKPYWNHDGGTIIFGPDGYLYIAVGDGGLANDPQGNGQKLNVQFGKILRLDVDRKEGELPYAIPKDNPFVGKEGARGEIWAYGLRNPWRMAFDRKTGTLWEGEVGQDTWEEINLIVKGGNYGWNFREGFHKFPRATEDKKEGMIEPIFEYHHNVVGKSITGGFVYRGKQIPELDGAYLYADYVAGRLWALRYDESKKELTENREIPMSFKYPIMSFGEDQDGNVYFMTASLKGDGIYRLGPATTQTQATGRATGAN